MSYYPLYDGHGSVIALSDSNGVVTDTYDYTLYGKIRDSTGSTSNPYQYSGERTDSETGFQYLRARYYNTDSGRFTTRDTWAGVDGSPVTLNKYLYGNGNPVRYVDPSGYMGLLDLMTSISILSEISSIGVKMVGFVTIGIATVWGIPKDAFGISEASRLWGVSTGISVSGVGVGGGLDIISHYNKSELWFYGYLNVALSLSLSPSGWMKRVGGLLDNLTYSKFEPVPTWGNLAKHVMSGKLLGAYWGMVWDVDEKKGQNSYEGVSVAISLTYAKSYFPKKILDSIGLSGTLFSAGRKGGAYGFYSESETGAKNSKFSLGVSWGKYWYLGSW